MSGERYNIHSQLEHLQSKYIGTGHADTTKFDWLTNQVRTILPSISRSSSRQLVFSVTNMLALFPAQTVVILVPVFFRFRAPM